MVWLKNGDPVNYTDRVYVSGYDASLQFSTVVHGDEGVYSVRLANEYDEVTSSNASLLVTGKLKKRVCSFCLKLRVTRVSLIPWVVLSLFLGQLSRVKMVITYKVHCSYVNPSHVLSSCTV